MSDANEFQVDPRLDALLARALSRGSLSAQQRQQHLERLGITPHLGGSAGRWRAPVVAGRPAASASPVPAALPSKRRRRQWLELGAAVLAVVLVASLLVALFRDWNGDEDDNQLAASPEATEETAIPSPTPEPIDHERLFAVSHIVDTSGEIQSGHVTAYEADTGEIDYWIDTGFNPDAVLSSDGTRLFVAADSEDGDRLTSYDALTGDENWSIDIENRVKWIFGDGPTALAVSQDGLLLFVYSASAPGDYTIQVFDATNGRSGQTIDGVADCTAQLFPSADGRSLYVVCLAERFAPQVIDLETLTSAGVIQGFGGVISGAAASADGRYLYITNDIDTELRLTVIDTNSRAIAEQRDIVHMASDPLHALNITAVSPDGSRLFIGIGSQPEGEAPVATQLWVWDTAALHNEAQKVPAPEAITGWSLAPGPDNASAFAICGHVICRLSLDNSTALDVFIPLDNELLRLFSGRVVETPETSDTEKPQPTPSVSTPTANAGICPTTPWTGIENLAAVGLPETHWLAGNGLALGNIGGGQQTASFQHFGNKTLLLTTGGAFYSGAYWVADAAQEHDQFDIPSGWTVALLPFHVSGGFATTYVPIQPSGGNEPTEIAVVDLNTNTVTRTIQPSAPFREIVFAGDEQFAFVTLVGDDDITTGIARIDLATGAETPLVDGFYGNLVAVANVGS